MDTATCLEELRQVAYDSNYNCESVMTKLIHSLNSHQALIVAFKQLESYLPIFEKKHPNMTWPREWLKAAQKLKPIDYHLHSFKFYDDDIPDSNSRSFMNSISILNSALRKYHEDPTSEIQNLAAVAMAGMVTARAMQYWIDNFPASWEVYTRIEQGEIVDEQGFEPVRQYKASPQRRAFEAKLWLAIADSVESVAKLA